MKALLVGASIFAFASLATVSIAPKSGDLHPRATAEAASTCTDKHCSTNTHCCYSCTGSPICVKNGVPCPECAPR